MPPFSLKVFICPLRKKFITKDKLDSKIFKHFVMKIAIVTKIGVYTLPQHKKGARSINLRARTHFIQSLAKTCLYDLRAQWLKFPKQ